MQCVLHKNDNQQGGGNSPGIVLIARAGIPTFFDHDILANGNSFGVVQGNLGFLKGALAKFGHMPGPVKPMEIATC